MTPASAEVCQSDSQVTLYISANNKSLIITDSVLCLAQAGG